RLATAFRPSAVSCSPRRSNQPTTHSSTLATNGTRHPHAPTCSLFSEALTSHAEPDPRMNPIVPPAAVELLMRPRVHCDDDSVVYTIEPVNSPPTENPWIKRIATRSSGAANPICS